LADAMVMALGTIKGPVGWFEPSTRELRRECEAMEARVHRWKPRRMVKEPMKVTLSISESSG
jgi:hypothetical protein